MLNYDLLDAGAANFAQQFRRASPIEHVVVDDFCDAVALSHLCDEIPSPLAMKAHKSRDYMFANNKYEKSGFRHISPNCEALYRDLTGKRFQTFLNTVTGQTTFVDPEFHGGGLHQGGEQSYLDMHADFNTHPLHHTWLRTLNILLYLNRDWRPDYKGQLKLRHKDRPEETLEIEPHFNRCVIMFTRDYTLHGYDAINFPEGRFRTSIACYAYSDVNSAVALRHRSTTWYPDNAGLGKRSLGRLWPHLVRLKTALFGSATARNK